jgi:zinc transporter
MDDAGAPDPYVPFDAEGGLIFATRLPGSASEFDHRRGWADLAKPESGLPLWVHLDRTRDHTKSWLRGPDGVPPLIADSLLAEETRPRVQAVGDGLLVILRGVNMNPGAEMDELISIRMWLEPTRIITLRQYRFQTIADLRKRAMQGQAPATAGAFLAAVATGLSLRLGPTVDNLEQMIETIENAMLESESDDSSHRARLALIRRQAISYRRYVVPQRDALMFLAIQPPPLIGERDAMELRIAAEQVARVAEALDELRDRAAVTQDEVRARHEVRMGRTLYLLTIVATIALPLGFITGLLGINVGGLPLAESTHGFLIVCVLLAGLGVLEVVLFRMLRLF